MNALILLTTTQTIEVNDHTGYITGAIIALFILGYLFFSLIKPEKF
ncbi:MAG: K(+)-transporting ATPase subunit F [Mariniphaga sp.]